jgi:NitT/TauT family transport system permease protein
VLPPYLVPAPSTIAWKAWGTKALMWSHALVTSYEIVFGFLLSVVGGVTLGAAVVSSRTAQKAVYPWLVVIQVVPKVAIGPLIVIWLGYGYWPKILIAFLLGFFPIMISTMHGLASVEREKIFLLQTMGAGRLKVFRYLLLFSSLPDICNSFKVAITLVTIGAIVGEFIGSDTGLGYVLISANGMLDSALLFVALVWITVVSLIFYAMVSVAEKLIVPWHTSVRSHPQ